MSKQSKTEEIKRVVCLLHNKYGSPRLGNKDDPVDELVYIILSTKTSDKVYQKTYENLYEKYHPWDKLLKAKVREITKVIEFGGMGKRKARLIKNCLVRVKELFGEVSLDSLKKIRDLKKIEDLLVSLPGVGVKTAKCVMLYSLSKKVLPVDIHTYRLVYRLGWVKSQKMRNEKGKLHEQLEKLVSKSLRYKLHVNAVAHGRACCLPGKPRCEDCLLIEYCDFPD